MSTVFPLFKLIMAHEFQAKFHWHVEDLGMRHTFPAKPKIASTESLG